MIDIICIDDNFSTTKLLTKEKPKLINNPEDKFQSILFVPSSEEKKEEGGLRTEGFFKKIYDDNPIITIITVVYNGEDFLEETILSVINQNYANVEYIIIDGGSSDTTVDIIRKYEQKIDYWVSENDQGIYDAMNKGIRLSRGNYLFHLNSGDYLVKNILQNIFGVKLNKQYDLVFGNVKYSSGKYVTSSLNKNIYLKNTLHHQSVFYLRKLFVSHGLYNIGYRVLADYDMNIRLYCSNVTQDKFDYLVCICSDGGVSDTPNYINYKEEILIRKKYINNRIIYYLLSTYSIMKFIFKKILRKIK